MTIDNVGKWSEDFSLLFKRIHADVTQYCQALAKVWGVRWESSVSVGSDVSSYPPTGWQNTLNKKNVLLVPDGSNGAPVNKRFS